MLSKLARYLNNYTTVLKMAGRLTKECSAYEEAVMIQRELVNIDHHLHRPALVARLDKYGHSLHWDDTAMHVLQWRSL